MMKRLLVMALGAMALTAVLGTEANAQAVPGEPIDQPITTSASVNGTFGAASALASNPGTQTDYFLLSTSLGINYQYNDALGFSVGSGYSKFLSQGGGLNSQFEGRIQDTTLSASLFPLFVEMEYLGIIASGGVSARLPTSRTSIREGLITSVTPNMALIKPFGGAILVWAISFTKNFHRFTSPTVPTDELDVILREGGAEDLGQDLVAIGGVLPSFSLRNTFLIIYNFGGRYQIRGSLGYADTWTYDNGTITADDELTNPNARPGRGHRQGVSGGFGGRYLVAGNSFFGRALVASVNVSTAGSPLTSTNEGTRFPFWDFENGIASRTSISFGLGGIF